jgi:hypothetical protein
MSDDLRKAVKRAISRVHARANADSDNPPSIPSNPRESKTAPPPPPAPPPAGSEGETDPQPEGGNDSPIYKEAIISDIKPEGSIAGTTNKTVMMIVSRR